MAAIDRAVGKNSQLVLEGRLLGPNGLRAGLVFRVQRRAKPTTRVCVRRILVTATPVSTARLRIIFNEIGAPDT